MTVSEIPAWIMGLSVWKVVIFALVIFVVPKVVFGIWFWRKAVQECQDREHFFRKWVS